MGDKKRPRGASSQRRPLTNRYILPEDANINYKNVNLLQRYLNERGKVVSRRISGVTAKEQRLLSEAIKRARFLALLPTGGVK